MSGLSDLLDFKLFEGKKILSDIGKKPTRFLTGVDPASTSVWNSVTGSDDKPIVDQWGGTTDANMDAMDRAGINTKPGRAMEGLAHVIASYFAMQGLAGSGGGASGGSTSASNATNPALIESAAGTPGYGASSAGAGGGTGISSGLTGSQWQRLGQQMQTTGDDSSGGQQDINGVDLAALAALEEQRRRELGVIAQSSRSVKTHGGDGISMARGIGGHDMIDANGVQIAAIKELNTRIEDLQRRIAAAKKRKEH